MRPPGEIRMALRSAFQDRGAVTWREALPALPGVNGASPADVRLVRRTVVNMVLAGELVAVGHSKVAGSSRWHTVYEPSARPADDAQPPGEAVEALTGVVWNWGAGR